jgi:hypothetical protein
MSRPAKAPTLAPNKSQLDRTLSLFTDVRTGEGATAVLMLANIFLLLVCSNDCCGRRVDDPPLRSSKPSSRLAASTPTRQSA